MEAFSVFFSFLHLKKWSLFTSIVLDLAVTLFTPETVFCDWVTEVSWSNQVQTRHVRQESRPDDIYTEIIT